MIEPEGFKDLVFKINSNDANSETFAKEINLGIWQTNKLSSKDSIYFATNPENDFEDFVVIILDYPDRLIK